MKALEAFSKYKSKIQDFKLSRHISYDDYYGEIPASELQALIKLYQTAPDYVVLYKFRHLLNLDLKRETKYVTVLPEPEEVKKLPFESKHDYIYVIFDDRESMSDESLLLCLGEDAVRINLDTNYKVEFHDGSAIEYFYDLGDSDYFQEKNLNSGVEGDSSKFRDDVDENVMKELYKMWIEE